MAQRRMFSKEITTSDHFVDMPQSTQLLYFHLGMEADDEGFIGNARMLSRAYGANSDDSEIAKEVAKDVKEIQTLFEFIEKNKKNLFEELGFNGVLL